MKGPLRILHVDDDPQFAKVTKAALEEKNDDFTVFIEHSGEAALARLAEDATSIDCVLSDYQMPGMDGISLLQAVRKQYPQRTLPFILFTSQGNETIAAKALNAGATSYIQKGGSENYEYVSERIRRDVEVVQNRQSRTRFEGLIQAINDPVYLLDVNSRFIFVNDAFVELAGYDREEILGSDPSLIKDQRAVSESEEQLKRLLSTDSLDSVTFEVKIQPADGPPIPCEERMGTLPPDRDTFEGSIGVLRDISERKETEDRLAAIIRNSPDLISILDDDGRVLESSAALEPILGYGPEELDGELVFEFVHPDDRDRVASAFAEMVNQDDIETQRVQYRFKHSDGSWRWLESIGSTRGDETLAGYIIVSRDITKRKDRERRFRQTLERMQALIRSESQTELAQSAVRIADDGISLPYAGMHLESDDREKLVGVAGNAAMDEHFEEVPVYQRNDGDRDIDQLIWDIYESGEQVVINNIPESERIDAAETPMGSTLIQPIPNYAVFITSATKAGAVDEIDRILVQMLATNLKAVFERLEHNHQIERQRDNLELLNQVLRHDIRNDLQVISSHLGLLADQVDKPERQESIQTALRNAQHAYELTETARQIADVMLLADDHDGRSNLRETLRLKLDDLQSRYPNAMLSVEGSIPDVDIPIGELFDSVLGNVMKNAVDHNDTDQPKVMIRAERENGQVEVRIADNGPGVPDTEKPEIFDKGEKRLESAGSGMGLYLVETLVSRCDGSISVEDNDPRGAVFVLELPIAS